MLLGKWIVCSMVLPAAAYAQVELVADSPPANPAALEAPQIEPAPLNPLPAGTPVIVALDSELSTQTSLLGDSFSVTVTNDVMQDGIIVIPKGTRGRGEVTFVTKKGAFGKPGIIGIALRDMELNGRQVLLDGRFREEGANNNGAAAATMFAVGIVAGLVKGKTGVIPAGRELKGRTGEDIGSTPTLPSPVLPSAELPPIPPAI